MVGFIFRVIFSAGWELGLAGAFLITWIAPDTFGERTVHKLTFLMLVEFLVVHSTGFYAGFAGRSVHTPWWKTKNPERSDRIQRAMTLTGLTLLYCLLALGFSAMYGGPWPLFAFLMVALPKFPAMILRPLDDDGQFSAMANWAAMTLLYLGGCFLTLVYNVPPLGVTPEVIANQEFGVGGEWPEQPYRVMAFGAFYFAGLSLVSLATEVLAYARAREERTS